MKDHIVTGLELACICSDNDDVALVDTSATRDNKPEPKPCLIYEYCVLRYVADVEREEFVNVGLMMMCKRRRWMEVRLHIDEERLRCIFHRSDPERLRKQLGVFIRKDVPSADLPVEERYRWLAAVKSAIIQTSPTHPGIIRYPDDASGADQIRLLSERFDTLFNRLIL